MQPHGPPTPAALAAPSATTSRPRSRAGPGNHEKEEAHPSKTASAASAAAVSNADDDDLVPPVRAKPRVLKVPPPLPLIHCQLDMWSLHRPLIDDVVQQRSEKRDRLNRVLLRLLARLPSKQPLDLSYLLDAGRRQRKKPTNTTT